MRLALIEIATATVVRIIMDGATTLTLPNGRGEVSPLVPGWEGGGDLWQLESGEWDVGEPRYRLVPLYGANIPVGERPVGDPFYELVGDVVQESYVTEPIPVEIPAEVSRRQFNMQLAVTGIRTTVEAWVASQSELVQISYAESAVFVRDDPMLQAGFLAFGFSNAQIDDFFLAASKL